MSKKTKKAIVLPETLKIIIGVLCLVILVYLAFSLYNIFVVKSKLAQASETLEQITAKINGLEEGKETDYLIVAPKGGWYLIRNSERACVCEDKALLEGLDECCRAGMSLELKGELFIDSICDFPDEKIFQECISFRNVPLNIDIIKLNSIIKIRTEDSIAAENIFEKLLEFKGTGNKTVKDLCQEYVNNQNFDLRKQLEDKVEEFFSDTKIGVKFEIVETANEKNVILPPLGIYYGKKIIASSEEYEFYQRVMDRRLEIKDSEGRSYTIILKIGEWQVSSGPRGVAKL